jgi:hypothetical protein
MPPALECLSLQAIVKDAALYRKRRQRQIEQSDTEHAA